MPTSSSRMPTWPCTAPRPTVAASTGSSNRRWMRACVNGARSNWRCGEVELYYQPILNLATGNVHCCEALLRWHHPERSMVSPAEFVPIAEEIGLIVPLGEWVIRQACADAAQWAGDVC